MKFRYKAPRGKVRRARVRNAFCPTGPGGGVDPSCSPGSAGKGGAREHKVYRGVGEGSDVSSGFEWFSETPTLAGKYAEHRGGQVVEAKISYAKPFNAGNPKAVQDARSFFAEASAQADTSKLDRKKVLESRREFLDHFGSERRELVDYWSNPTAKERTRKLLESLGFDAITMKEGGENTVALLRRKPVSNARKRRGTSPLRTDPSRTGTLRRALVGEMRRRIKHIRLAIHDLVAVEDAFGLGTRRGVTMEDLTRERPLPRLVLRDNAFCPTGVGGGVDPGCSPGGGTLGRAVGALRGAEHAVGEAVGAGFRRLPSPVQSGVKKVLAVAFAPFTAGQVFAERVARERGLSPEKAASLRSTLATADLVAFKGAKVASLAGLPGAGLATLISGSVPVASAAYVAYSTARDPVATYRAARSIVKDAAARLRIRKGRAGRSTYRPSVELLGNVSPREADLVVARITAAGYDDWYAALFAAALEETGNVRDALELADEAYADDKPPIANALTANQRTENVFCPTGEGGGVDPTCSPGGGKGVGQGALDAAKAKGGSAAARANELLASPQADAVLSDIPAGSKFLAAGREALVFKTPEGDIARVGKKVDRPDVPEILQPTSVTRHGDYVVERLPFATDVGSSGREVWTAIAALEKGLREKGYLIHDLGPENVGKVNGVWKFIDPGEITRVPARNVLTTNQRWRHLSDPEKAKVFKAWLENLFSQEFLGDVEEALWERYIQEGFEKGAGRAWDEASDKVRRFSPGEGRDFVEGSRRQFLRDAFARPEAVEKVKLMAGRSFSDLEGVTEQSSKAMTRVLTDGLVQGKNPREVAREMTNVVDALTRPRAETIARTEMIRAHAEGQLSAFELLGVEEVGAAVEWLVTDDAKVCELCAPLAGVVLKIDEARGMLPRHPNCRCAWMPALVGEKDAGRKTTKGAIDKAVSRSRGDDEDWGPGEDISRSRPRGVFNRRQARKFERFWVVVNAFCPTGPGGGIDPSCSPGGGSKTASTGLAELRAERDAAKRAKDQGKVKEVESRITARREQVAQRQTEIRRENRQVTKAVAEIGDIRRDLPDPDSRYTQSFLRSASVARFKYASTGARDAPSGEQLERLRHVKESAAKASSYLSSVDTSRLDREDRAYHGEVLRDVRKAYKLAGKATRHLETARRLARTPFED